MHREPDIIERRLARVRREYLTPAIWARGVSYARMWTVPDCADGTLGEPVPVEIALGADDWVPARPGTAWGRPWATVWFRLDGQIPPDWAGRPVEAILNLGFNDMAPGFMGEGLIWQPGAEGSWVPWRGLHPSNHVVRVTDSADGGETVSYLVEASANPLMWGLESTPNSDRDTAWAHPIYSVSAIDLTVINLDVRGLHHDLRALTGLMAELPVDGPRRWEILHAIDDCLDAIDLEDVVGSAAAARSELVDVLSRPAVPSAHKLSAVGHAHIDTAWLWPLRETERKVTRSFTNALRTAEDEPEFRFACSQAVQYDWMRRNHPSVFADIVAAVERGQWIPVGGSWVEADGNVTGGESMARQFLHGQRFFREHFGVTCTEVWIPDVFGYPASFPQLFRLGGFERFLTQKMSWNRTNRFPHHTFMWEGIDGSRVLTHFPPVDTYGGLIEPFELAKAERQFAEKGRATRSMLLFGHGDGGGGPAPDMLERYRRLREHRRPADASRWSRRLSSSMPPSRSTPTRRCGSASSTSRCTGAPTRPRPGRSRATAGASCSCARPSCGRSRPSGVGPRTATPPMRWNGSGRRCSPSSSTTSSRDRPSAGCTARPRRPMPASSPSSRN